MRRHLALGLLALLLAVPGTAAAQDATEAAPLGLEVLDARLHPDIQIIVSLPAGMVDSTLDESAFTVTENGVPVPTRVAPVPTEGLDVVLLMDTSGSMRGAALTSAKGAADAFVAQMPAEVGVAVVAFGAEAKVVSPFGAERSDTLSAIGSLVARGETALYDGLVAGTALFADTTGNRRVVVMLSDGGDTVSSGTLEDAIVALLSKDVRFYAVELQTSENDHEPLARLGAASDGRVVPAGDPDALDGIFGEVAASIVSQYVINYRSPSFGDTNIAVTVAGASGALAAIAQRVSYPAAPPPPPPPPGDPVPEPEVLPEPVVVQPSPEPLPPLPTEPIVLGWLASRDAMLLGVGALFLAFLGLAWYAGRGGRRVTLAAADAKAILRTKDASMLSRATNSVAGFAERTLERRGRRGQLESALEAAGMTLRTGEFVVLVSAGALTGFGLGYSSGQPLLGIVLALAVLVGSWLIVTRRADGRRKAFETQLFATLQLISGSLRAGFGLAQAFEVVAEESAAPTSDEFRRVRVETHLGRDLDETLSAMARRVGSEDFELFIEAVQIHREIGGELSQIVDNVSETIRERSRLKGQVRALSAEGRFSAVVLTVIPVGMAIFLSVTNPDYLGELTSLPAGRLVIGVGVALMVVGMLWLKRLVRLDF